MSAKNAILRYRPIRSGIRILNQTTELPGTLGFFGKSADGNLWLVSCYHVLIRNDGSSPLDGEKICQPKRIDADIIAITDLKRASKELDCAAALIKPGIDVTAQVCGLGAMGKPKSPAVGMRVVKSGANTGVTEGVVSKVENEVVQVKVLNGLPSKYELSGSGDSGALWIEQGTLCPVALHNCGESGTQEFAGAIDIDRVLRALRLDFWTDN